MLSCSCSRRDEDKNAQMREDALLVVLLRILAFAHLHIALNCNWGLLQNKCELISAVF